MKMRIVLFRRVDATITAQGGVVAIDDVITNTAGALIGWTAYRRLQLTFSVRVLGRAVAGPQ